MKIKFLSILVLLLSLVWGCRDQVTRSTDETFKSNFLNPPDSVRPGVYWYFMDGNISREAMTEDLESMKAAGIGNLVFLEVNVGLPRGKVDFLSKEWLELFHHAEKEAERLGIRITLGLGPGWTGSGGPWVKPEQSMQHLVSSVTVVKGPSQQRITLPQPAPKKPYFGENGFTPELLEQWKRYYQDVAVLAFPTPAHPFTIPDSEEKALYYRAPYSSVAGTKPFLTAPAQFLQLPGIEKNKILDLTRLLQPDGSLHWQIPAGQWTIMRFGSTNNGAVTRPAPIPGVGFESDKFDTAAFNAHFTAFLEKLIPHPTSKTKTGGLTTLHMDSWEMGAQNWSAHFREAFQRRRGYDPLPFFPVYAGLVVGNLELSERFLWDLRITAQELVIENHAEHAKRIARRYGLNFSIEPYDMNPTADLDLGAVADVPMCEFWNKGIGYNTSFSSIEATSIAHVMGRPVVSSEAFTSDWGREGYTSFPGNMKNQSDWAFGAGINRFVFHTFVHKTFGNQVKPGLTMGGYGVHWDRGQTWWPMVSAYHQYISRCAYLLQQGRTIADLLYLTPEGAPHVFRPPASATIGNDSIPDRRGYNFDGCSPNMLMKLASVKDHQIVFPGGGKFKLLVLSSFETMTPELLTKLESLIAQGALVVGAPPLRSPSLVNFPACDQQVKKLAQQIWGSADTPKTVTERNYGKGKIFWGGELTSHQPGELYPHYNATASVLAQMNVHEDFGPSETIRYTHRETKELDLYFVSNKSNAPVSLSCTFNIQDGSPELWDPITGSTRMLSNFRRENDQTIVPLKWDSYQSYFIVFHKTAKASIASVPSENFPQSKVLAVVDGKWDVAFDPKWGGPAQITFDQLTDWTTRPEEGIRYYSGIATYRKTIELSQTPSSRLLLSTGEINGMARVRINGKDAGVVWTAPWQVEITPFIQPGKNALEIEVANLWPNRLIGDAHLPDDGIQNGQWPSWLTRGKARTSGRYTFCSYAFYKANSPLLKSGLLGPVQILTAP